MPETVKDAAAMAFQLEREYFIRKLTATRAYYLDDVVPADQIAQHLYNSKADESQRYKDAGYPEPLLRANYPLLFDELERVSRKSARYLADTILAKKAAGDEAKCAANALYEDYKDRAELATDNSQFATWLDEFEAGLRAILETYHGTVISSRHPSRSR